MREFPNDSERIKALEKELSELKIAFDVVVKKLGQPQIVEPADDGRDYQAERCARCVLGQN